MIINVCEVYIFLFFNCPFVFRSKSLKRVRRNVYV